MNAPTFTSGPWRAVPTTALAQCPDTLRQDVVSDGTEFAPSFVAGDMTPEDATAVAALPELYESLTRAEKKLAHLHAHYSGAEADGIYSVIREARAALAKASA